jgi:iron complex transport system substrate-binding protein
MQSTRKPRPQRSRALGLTLIAVLTLAACGEQGATNLADSDPDPDPDGAAEPTEADAQGTDAPDGFPLTVENCGEEITFDAPPERVVLLNSAPVTSLAAIGALDRVIARAGAFPDGYFDDATRGAIADIPSLGDELDDSGHLQISQEVIIDQEPDLIMGLADGMSREGFDAVGIPVIVETAFCPDGGLENPDFDDIYAQVSFHGEVFGLEDAAAAAVSDLQERLDAIESAIVEDGEERTAATLFPTIGGTPFAYGTRSMAHPQLEAAGFTNAFADTDDRVFEVTIEELLDRDPDVLILLHVDGEPGPVEDAVTSLPGAEGLTAVQNDDVLVQLFNFTEPPTPLSLDGLEAIVERFGSDE